MFLFEKCYDIDELTRRNMHVHTNFSTCAKPEMVLEDIAREAIKQGLTHIALVDHSNMYRDREVPAHNEILKEQRKNIEKEIDGKLKIYIGSEISAYGVGLRSETAEVINKMEYRHFAQNHYHLSWWEHPEIRDPKHYAEHIIRVLEELFRSGLADCVAHPIVPIKLEIFNEANPTVDQADKILDYFTDNVLGDLMTLGEENGCAWELHLDSVAKWPEFEKRYFNIGREVGVHFNFGSDAHKLIGLNRANALEILKKALI